MSTSAQNFPAIWDGDVVLKQSQIEAINYQIVSYIMSHSRSTYSKKDIEFINRWYGFSYANSEKLKHYQNPEIKKQLSGLMAPFVKGGNLNESLSVMVDRGLGSIYTPESLSMVIGDVIKKNMGAELTRVLIPGVGKGSFCQPFVRMEQPPEIRCCEVDPISFTIATKRFPQLNAQYKAFEDVPINSDNTFDLAITHVPSGPILHPESVDNEKWVSMCHNEISAFFILKSLSALRFGGLGAFIVPRKVIDGVELKGFRGYIMRYCRLVSLLPLGADIFTTSSGTNSANYLLVLQKVGAKRIENDTLLTLRELDFIKSQRIVWSVKSQSLDRPKRDENYLLYSNQYVDKWATGEKLLKDFNYELVSFVEREAGDYYKGYYLPAKVSKEQVYKGLSRALEADFKKNYLPQIKAGSDERFCQAMLINQDPVLKERWANILKRDMRNSSLKQVPRIAHQPNPGPSERQTPTMQPSYDPYTPAVWADNLSQGLLQGLTGRGHYALSDLKVIVAGAGHGSFCKYFYETFEKADSNIRQHLFAVESDKSLTKQLRETFPKMSFSNSSYMSENLKGLRYWSNLVISRLPSGDTTERDFIYDSNGLLYYVARVDSKPNTTGKEAYSLAKSFVIRSWYLTNIGGVNVFIMPSKLIDQGEQSFRRFLASNYRFLGILPLPTGFMDDEHYQGNHYILMLQKIPFQRELPNDVKSFVEDYKPGTRLPDQLYSMNPYVNERLTNFFQNRADEIPFVRVFDPGKPVRYVCNGDPAHSESMAKKMAGFMRFYLNKRLLTRQEIDKLQKATILGIQPSSNRRPVAKQVPPAQKRTQQVEAGQKPAAPQVVPFNQPVNREVIGQPLNPSPFAEQRPVAKVVPNAIQRDPVAVTNEVSNASRQGSSLRDGNNPREGATVLQNPSLNQKEQEVIVDAQGNDVVETVNIAESETSPRVYGTYPIEGESAMKLAGRDPKDAFESGRDHDLLRTEQIDEHVGQSLRMTAGDVKAGQAGASDNRYSTAAAPAVAQQPEGVEYREVYLYDLSNRKDLSLEQRLAYRGLSPYGDPVAKLSMEWRDRKPIHVVAVEHFHENMILNFEGRLWMVSKKQRRDNVRLLVAWKAPDEANKERMMSYVRLRDAYWTLDVMEKETLHVQQRLRNRLKGYYNRLSLKYNSMHDPDWVQAVQNEPFFNQVQGLEQIKDGVVQLDPLFYAPDVSVIERSSDADKLRDQFYIWLDKEGRCDLDAFAKEVNVSVEDLITGALGGVVFYDPDQSAWMERAEFLQGNAYLRIQSLERHLEDTSKLDYVKITSIRQAIHTLKECCPAQIPFDDIVIELGAPWIPVSVYDRFLYDRVHEPIKTFYNPYKHNYSFAMKDKQPLNALWGDTDVEATAVLKFAFENTIPKTKNMKSRFENYEDVLSLYGQKIDEIRDDFKAWVKGLDQESKNQLQQIYNEKLNGLLIPDLSVDYRQLSDMHLDKLGVEELYPSQRSAIHQILLQEGGMVDHEVGLGKTITECGIAHELMRMGKAKKVLLVVTKATCMQVFDTYTKLYPDDKVFFRSPNSRSGGQYGHIKFLRSIESYKGLALVIMTREQFREVQFDRAYAGVGSEFERECVNQTIAGLLNKSDEYQEAYYMKQKLNSSVASLRKLYNDLNVYRPVLYADQGAPTFSSMGFEHLIIDEAHGFKNIFSDTKHLDAKGLTGKNTSKQALVLYEAIRYLQHLHNGDKGVTLVSGTFLTNSLSELYTYMHFLCPRRLHELGCLKLDGWLATFARFTSDYELTWTMEVLLKQRLSNFNNAPELQRAYLSMANYQDAKTIHLKKPEVETHFELVEQTANQKKTMFQLHEMLQKGLNPESSVFSTSQLKSMISIVGLERMISSDVRLLNPSLFKDEVNPKIQRLAENVAAIYKDSNAYKGTQFIFCDLGVEDSKRFKDWNIYKEIKKALVEKGIPEAEIVAAQKSKEPKPKQKLIQKVNDGEVRVVIGSTPVWGEGINAQKRCVATHMFDTPWTYKDIVQRQGRMERQGNWAAENFTGDKVHVYYYASQRSIDAYKFTVLEKKQRFTEGFKSTKKCGRIIDESLIDEEGNMSQGTFARLTSGCEEFIEKEECQCTVKRLTYMKSSMEKKRRQLIDDCVSITDRIAELKALIEAGKQDKIRFENGENAFLVQSMGKTLEGEAVGKYLSQAQVDDLVTSQTEVATFRGFPVLVNPEASSVEVSLQGAKMTYTTHRKFPEDYTKVPSWLARFANDISKQVEQLESELSRLERELPLKQEALSKLEWKDEDELQEAARRLTELEEKFKGNAYISGYKRPEIQQPEVVEKDGVYGIQAEVNGMVTWHSLTMSDYEAYANGTMQPQELAERVYINYDKDALLPSSDGQEISTYFSQFIGGHIDLDIGKLHVHGYCTKVEANGDHAVLSYTNDKSMRTVKVDMYAGYGYDIKANQCWAEVKKVQLESKLDQGKRTRR